MRFQKIMNFFEQKFAEAAAIFARVIGENPQDQVARRFLYNAAQLSHEGTPNDWTGVEVLGSK